MNPDELSESAQARGVIVSQVIPAPRPANQVSVTIVKECAEALKELNGASLNYTSLESCIAAKALVIALRHAGPNPTRESILHAMASFGHVDLGGFILHYSATDHQGSNWVELTMLSRGNRYVR